MRLEEKIKEKRKHMIYMGMSKGFTHIEVVKCSQELDRLINVYQKECCDEKAVKSKVYCIGEV